MFIKKKKIKYAMLRYYVSVFVKFVYSKYRALLFVVLGFIPRLT